MLTYKVILHKKGIDVEIGGKRDTFFEIEEKRETSSKRGKKGKKGSGVCTLGIIDYNFCFINGSRKKQTKPKYNNHYKLNCYINL